MRKRGLIIVLAVALAAGVLGTAWMLGGPSPANTPQAGPGDFYLPEDAPANQPNSAGADGPQIRNITGPRYTREDGERVTTFGADRVQPQAEFVFDAERPFARIAAGRKKLLVIEAAHGVFYLPGNEPQRGEFSGDVVMSMYESPDESAVDPSKPSHLQLRAYLDEQTTFDRDLGQLRSDGPVHVTGTTFDFKGTGLVALYNQSFERIDKLTINKGEHLRFSRHRVEHAQPDPATPAAEPNPVETAADVSPTQPPDAVAASPSAIDAKAAPVYYRADFTGDVFVAAGPDEGTLAGQTLSVFFTAETVDDVGETASADNTSSLAMPRAGSAAGARLIASASTTDRSLMPRQDDDIVITWSGPLVLEPVETLPTLLAENGSDAQLLTMTGDGQQPVRGQAGNNDRFTADRVEYLTQPRKLRAIGSEALPLTFRSEEHGTATGQTLDADLDAGNATLAGPGRLEGHLHQPFAIAFSEAMRLSFTTQDTPVLTKAEFIGSVEAAGPSDRQSPDIRDAKLRAQRMVVSLKPDTQDASQSVPESLLLEGDALAEQPGQSIRTQRIFAQFAEVSEPAASAGDEQTWDAALGLSRVQADGRVLVQAVLPDDQLASNEDAAQPVSVVLKGDRLIAIPPENKLDLLGSDDEHAVLQHPQATLTGRQLLLTDAPQSLRVPGPGTLLAPLDDQDPDSRLTLAWNGSFTYDGSTRVALARGSVEATTTSPTDDTSLGCDELELLLLPQEQRQANRVALQRARARMLNDQPEDRVHFTAQSFDAEQPSEPQTRLTLYGPELIFTNNTDEQQVVVPGAGELLAEDYRAANATDEAQRPQVAVSGRGVTLMQWADRLTLDLTANDMRAEGRLFINHDPLDGQGRVQLYGQALTSDLLETGGLGAWVGGEAPSPTIRTVTVRRDVVITHRGLRVDADTLRYLGEEQKVLLLADEGKRVTVVDPKSRAPQSSEAFTWDLVRNRLSATRTTGGTVPLE